MPFSLRESIASRIRRVANRRYKRSKKGRARAWEAVVAYAEKRRIEAAMSTPRMQRRIKIIAHRLRRWMVRDNKEWMTEEITRALKLRRRHLV